MVPTLVIVAALLVALAALVAAAWFIAKTHQEQLAFVTAAHNDAMQLARANSDMKFMPVIVQTAMAVSERVDSRVKERIAFTNAQMRAARGEEPEAPGRTISEPPVVSMSSIVDDAAEIARELSRYQREGRPDVEEYDPREAGVGQAQQI